MSDTRSPDLDARPSEDVERERASERAVDALDGMRLNGKSWFRRTANDVVAAVLSAANHAELLEELDRVEQLARRIDAEAMLLGASSADVIEAALPMLREGWVLVHCDVCGGDGEVSWLANPPDPQTEERATCSKCRGEGELARPGALASSLETDTEDGGRDE
jgi:hypothetical protein